MFPLTKFMFLYKLHNSFCWWIRLYWIGRLIWIFLSY